MIAYCGIDCSKCDAYIATITNDSELKTKTAKDWSKLNNATILPKHINCNGCRKDGAKNDILFKFMSYKKMCYKAFC